MSYVLDTIILKLGQKLGYSDLKWYTTLHHPKMHLLQIWNSYLK